MTFDKLFKLEVAAAPVTSTFSSLSHSPRSYLKHNFVIIISINYTIIIIICITNNNAVISNNYGWRQDLILLFKIPMDTRKNFVEICEQFGHSPSNKFASPGLRYPGSPKIANIQNLQSFNFGRLVQNSVSGIQTAMKTEGICEQCTGGGGYLGIR